VTRLLERDGELAALRELRAEKTVETHLGHVLRKLDLRSRSQLPEALANGQAAAASVAGRGGVAYEGGAMSR
jgi:hypothetical protein